MTDATSNRFCAHGTNAERAAFTPDPATPVSGPPQGYLFYDDEDEALYAWDFDAADWVAVGGGLPAASTTEVLTGTSTTKAGTPDSIAALWEQGSDIASAGTISVGEGGYFHVTGTTTITDIDFGTTKAGRAAKLVFDGALTLTHNATTLILPTGANITTAAGDTCLVVSEGGDNVRVTDYMRKDGTALVGSGSSAKVLISEVVTSASQANVTFSSISSSYRDLEIRIRGRCDAAGGNADREIALQFNSDTGSNYNYQAAFIQNGTAGKTGSAGATQMLLGFLPAAGSTANYAGALTITIPDYKGTTFFKQAFSHGGQAKTSAEANHLAAIGHGNWLSTTAINAVKVFLTGGNFVDNSVVSLYGHT